MGQSDHRLLELWREGDSDAGNQLFRRHWASVRRFFRNKVDAVEVEELISRTFMGCVEAQSRFRGDATFRTFLFAVARNQLYKYLRELRVQQSRMDPDFGVSSVFGLGMSPSAVASAREEHQQLLVAMQRVSVEQQTLLELHYWEGLGGPELAAVFEVSPGAIRVRLHRARARLREVLAELGNGELDVEAAAAILRGS